MSESTTEAVPDEAPSAFEREMIRRFRRKPLGPYDPQLQAFLLPLRNLPASGKHALMRLGGQDAWTLVQLGDRDRPVRIVGGYWTSRADAEWGVFRARWLALRRWDPETIGV